MKRTRINRLFISLLLIVTTRVAGEDKKASPPSNTVKALRVVQLSSQNQAHVDQAMKMIDENFRLREAVEAVTRTVGIDNEKAEKCVSLTSQDQRAEIAFQVDLTPLEKSEQRPLAAEAVDEAVKSLQAVLDFRFSDLQNQNLQDLGLTKNTLALKLNRLSEEVAKTKMEFAHDISPESIHQLLYLLETQSENVQIDQAAKEARSNALMEQLAKFSDQIQAKVKDDPIANELEQVLKVRVEMLDRAKQAVKGGAAPQSELNAEIGAVAEAKAKLLERRETAIRAAGGDIVATANRELMNLAVDLAELKARAEALRERLEKYRDRAGSLDYRNFQLQQAQTDALATRKQLEEIDQQMTNAVADARRERIVVRMTLSKNTPATQPSSRPE